MIIYFCSNPNKVIYDPVLHINGPRLASVAINRLLQLQFSTIQALYNVPHQDQCTWTRSAGLVTSFTQEQFSSGTSKMIY